jgi:Ca2+-binding RTX toxin-like protein
VPGAGRDTVKAGSGNDTINTRDNVRDVVDCGSGKDTVAADLKDALRHCENVVRLRA